MKKFNLFSSDVQQQLKTMLDEWMNIEQNRKIERFQELNKISSQGRIGFTGDSIIEMYPVDEMFNKELNIYNRGISGFTSKQLLDNVNDQVIDLKPQKIFILIGTNDLEANSDIKMISTNIKKICFTIKDKLDNPEIYILSIFPVNEKEKYSQTVGSRTNKKIIELNNQISNDVSSIKDVNFLDLFWELLENHQLKESYTYDGLHLSINGYNHITEFLSKYVY